MVNGVLMIHSVNQSDAGMYQCLAENKYGAIYASAELKILGMQFLNKSMGKSMASFHALILTLLKFDGVIVKAYFLD